MLLRRAAPAFLAAVLACAKPSPSPEYARAQERWTALVQERGTEAAFDARTDEVLALLAQVSPKSLDADSAAALRTHIEEERRSAAEEEARRARLVAQAGAPTPPPSGAASPSASSAATSGGTAGAAAPAASAPAPDGAGGPAAAAPPAGDARQAAAPGGLPPLAPGLKLAEFQKAYGACFEDRGSVTATPASAPAPQDAKAAPPPAKPTTPVDGRMWGMKDLIACREKHPALTDKLVIFAGDAFAGLAPRATLKVERKQVELGKLPDGKVGMVVDGKVVPLPPGSQLDAAGEAAKP